MISNLQYTRATLVLSSPLNKKNKNVHAVAMYFNGNWIESGLGDEVSTTRQYLRTGSRNVTDNVIIFGIWCSFSANDEGLFSYPSPTWNETKNVSFYTSFCFVFKQLTNPARGLFCVSISESVCNTDTGAFRRPGYTHPKKSVIDCVTTIQTVKLHATEDGGKIRGNAQRHNRKNIRCENWGIVD